MASLYEWRRLREIERDFESTDPDLVAKLRFTAPKSAQRTELYVALAAIGVLTILLGGIGGSAAIIAVGVLIGVITATMWLVARHGPRENTPDG